LLIKRQRDELPDTRAPPSRRARSQTRVAARKSRALRPPEEAKREAVSEVEARQPAARSALRR
jgi:hypothetical protein